MPFSERAFAFSVRRKRARAQNRANRTVNEPKRRNSARAIRAAAVSVLPGHSESDIVRERVQRNKSGSGQNFERFEHISCVIAIGGVVAFAITAALRFDEWSRASSLMCCTSTH